VVAASPALAARHPAACSPAAWAAAATEGTAVFVVAAAHGAALGAALLAAALRAAAAGDVATALSARPRGSDAAESSSFSSSSTSHPQRPFRPPRRLVLDAALGEGGLDGIRPAMAVVLNLGGDAAALADAERIARRLRPGGALLLCGDDAGAAALQAALAGSPSVHDHDDEAARDAEAAPAARALVTFGLGARNDWRAVGCRVNGAGGTDFTAVRGGSPVCRVSLRAPGEAAVLAALGALAAAALLAAAEPTASPGGGMDMVTAAVGPASGTDPQTADAAADALRRCRGVARSMQRVGCAFAGRSRRRVLCYDHAASRPEAAAAALAAAAQLYDCATLWAVAAAPRGMADDAAATDAFAAALAGGAARVVALPAPGAAARDAEALAAAVRARGVAAAAAAQADDVASRLAFELLHAPPPGADDAAADEAAPPVVLLTLGPDPIQELGAALLKRLRQAQRL
jgi:UDP-N-acetylmuramate--alanine ligase